MLTMLTVVVLAIWKEYSFVLSVRVACLNLLALFSEILLFDRSEFYLTVTSFQTTYNVLTWFTNVALFYLSVSV